MTLNLSYHEVIKLSPMTFCLSILYEPPLAKNVWRKWIKKKKRKWIRYSKSVEIRRERRKIFIVLHVSSYLQLLTLIFLVEDKNKIWIVFFATALLKLMLFTVNRYLMYKRPFRDTTYTFIALKIIRPAYIKRGIFQLTVHHTTKF